MNGLGSLFDGLTGGAGFETVLSGAAGVAAAVIVYVVLSSLVVRDPLARRARSLMERRRALRAGQLTPDGHQTRRMVEAAGLMAAVVKRLYILRAGYADSVSLALARAGWRSKDALMAFLFFKTVNPVLLGGGVAVAAFMPGVFAAPLAAKLLAVLAAVAVGVYSPEVFVKNRAQKRAQAIQKGLPDALDLLVICAEAGLALDAALNRVAREMAPSCAELADEFLLTAIELGFLPSRRDALQNLSRRSGLPGLRGVVNTLLQTEKYGTPLAQSLRVLSEEFRSERMMKAEEKAARLPATLTIPLVAFILPTLFVVLLGPAVLRAVDGLGSL